MKIFVTTLVLMAVFACNAAPQDAGETPILSFRVAHVRLVAGADTSHLRVELATTSQQQTLGLMERRQLADSAGMLFVYSAEQPATAGFWMFRTRIPLDIAFIDSLGTIVAVRHMVPCASTLAEGCPSYAPDVPYRAALEVGAGYLAQHKLTVGSTVMLGDTATVVP